MNAFGVLRIALFALLEAQSVVELRLAACFAVLLGVNVSFGIFSILYVKDRRLQR